MSTGAGVSASPKGDAGVKGRADRAGERFRGLPTHTFGPASEEPYRRRTSDWVRVVVAVVAPRVARRVPRQSEPRESGPVPVLQRPSRTICSPSSRRCTGRGRSGPCWWSPRRVHRPSLAVGSRSHDRRAARRGRRPGRWRQFVDEQVAVEDLRRGHAPRPSHPQFPLVRLAVVAAVVAAASPYVTRPTRRLGPVVRVRARVLGDVSGDGVSERHPRGAVPRVGRRGARASRVRLAGRAPDHAQVAASLAELGVTARDVHLDPTQPTGCVPVPRAGRSGPVVGPGHRSRRGRQPVLREAVALRGLQGLRSAAVPDPRAGRRARGLHPAARRARQGSRFPTSSSPGPPVRALRSSSDARSNGRVLADLESPTT